PTHTPTPTLPSATPALLLSPPPPPPPTPPPFPTRRSSDLDLAPLLQAELGETVVEYQRLKERTGRLDFLDLLIRARDLLIQSRRDRKSTRLNSSHVAISYAVFCLKKKTNATSAQRRREACQ